MNNNDFKGLWDSVAIAIWVVIAVVFTLGVAVGALFF